MLQYEVLKERLENEYRVKARFQPLRFTLARWLEAEPAVIEWLKNSRDYSLVEDRNGSPVLLADSPFLLNYAVDRAPGKLVLHEVEPL